MIKGIKQFFSDERERQDDDDERESEIHFSLMIGFYKTYL